MKEKIFYSPLLIFTLAVTPQLAYAHLVSTRFGEFYNGLLHPVSTLLHLLPWIAFGLIAGIQRLSLARYALLVFPLAVFIGVLLSSSLLVSAAVDTIIFYISLLTFISGVLAALALKLNSRWFVTLLVTFGFSHGLANGVGELAGGQKLLYALGVCLAAYILITLTTAASCYLISRHTWGIIAVRTLGSWIVAVGLMVGGYQLYGAPIG